jgi:heme A synthase
VARTSSPAERSPSRTFSPAGFRRVTLAVLVTQVIIVLTGAAVRLTGSGLGCSDWPNCEQDQLVPATDYNAVIEFVNRLMSFPVLAAVVLAVWAAGRRVPFRSELRTLSWAILGGVVVQVLLGAVVVRLELLPSTVIVHFLISMVIHAVYHERPDRWSVRFRHKPRIRRAPPVIVRQKTRRSCHPTSVERQYAGVIEFH